MHLNRTSIYTHRFDLLPQQVLIRRPELSTQAMNVQVSDPTGALPIKNIFKDKVSLKETLLRSLYSLFLFILTLNSNFKTLISKTKIHKTPTWRETKSEAQSE